MAQQRKPVIVRKFSRDWLGGYAVGSFGSDSPDLEILDAHGRVVQIGWEQIKWVCFVRELPLAGTAESANPEKLVQRRFTTRPRTSGLWMRLMLTDGEHLEGLAANDRSLVDGAGLMLTPPDTRSNTQRIYVPRTSIESLEVVGLIGVGSRKSHDKAEQPNLFATADAEPAPAPPRR